MSDLQAEKIERALAHARKLTEAGRKAEAVELLKRLCKAAPQNAQAFYALAAAAEGDLRQKALERAIALDSPLDDLLIAEIEPAPAPRPLKEAVRIRDLPGVVIEPPTAASQLRLGLLLFLRIGLGIVALLLLSTAFVEAWTTAFRPVTSLFSTFHPAWSPDGTRIAFTGVDTSNRLSIWVVNVDGSRPTNLFPCNCHPNLSPAWSPDGERLVYLGNSTGYMGVWVTKVGRNNQTVADPVAVWCCDVTSGNTNLYFPRWSPDNRSIVFGNLGVNNGRSSRDWFNFGDLYLIPAPDDMVYDANAARVINLTKTRDATERVADWSPDGKTLAYAVFDDPYSVVAKFQVQFLNIETGATRRLSFDETDTQDPAFSPDGQWVAYASSANGNQDIIVADLANSQPVNLTASSPGDDNQADWSPDGTRLVYTTQASSAMHLMLINRDGSSPVNLTKLMQETPPGAVTWIILWAGAAMITGLLAVFPGLLIPKRVMRKKQQAA